MVQSCSSLRREYHLRREYPFRREYPLRRECLWGYLETSILDLFLSLIGAEQSPLELWKLNGLKMKSLKAKFRKSDVSTRGHTLWRGLEIRNSFHSYC